MKAVITGDIVDSSLVADPAKLIRSLKMILAEIARQGLADERMWNLFRGDSFQMVTEPADALRAALAIRAGLRGGVYRLVSPLAKDEMLQSPMDARLGIGLGEVDQLSVNISESFGAAFTRSGQKLEQISKGSLRLAVKTDIKKLDDHFEIVCRLSDLIISDWSERSSQAVYRKLLMNETQEEMAEFFGIAQSSVQHRLKIAHMDEIDYLLAWFSGQVNAF